MTVVEARNLRKQYGKNLALKDVSFTIREGETIGLIGPNGAGKSTVMNILCGYLAPTAGSVKICGTGAQPYRIPAGNTSGVCGYDGGGAGALCLRPERYEAGKEAGGDG